MGWNCVFLSSVCICVCVAPVHTCEMKRQTQMQVQENENFPISCVGACACVCICVTVVHMCVFLRLYLHFRLYLRRTCGPGLSPWEGVKSEVNMNRGALDLLLKEVRAHRYCAFQLRTLYIRHTCAGHTSSHQARAPSKILNKI